MLSRSIVLALALAALVPLLAGGAWKPPQPSPTPCPPGVICLDNPLGAGSTPTTILNNVLDFLIIAGGIIVTIMVVIGAFQMLFAGGDPEKFSTGRRTIIYTVIAYAIIFVARGISSVIRDILT